MKLVFFKKPQARQFDYKPRYYDKEKEEREQRKKELGLSDGDSSTFFKGELKRRWKRDHARLQKEKKSYRNAIYLIMLVFAVYVIFFTNFIQNIVTSFLK